MSKFRYGDHEEVADLVRNGTNGEDCESFAMARNDWLIMSMTDVIVDVRDVGLTYPAWRITAHH